MAARHRFRRFLIRLRYRVERYFFLLLVVVAPIAVIGALVVVAYLGMTRNVSVADMTAFSIPKPVLEGWAILDPYLSREAEVILIGTLILGFLVMVAYVADRRTE